MNSKDADKRERRKARARKRWHYSPGPQNGELCGDACKLSCSYKIRHANEEGAAKHMGELKKKKGLRSPETLHVYFCKSCQSWYVGNRAESSKKK